MPPAGSANLNCAWRDSWGDQSQKRRRPHNGVKKKGPPKRAFHQLQWSERLPATAATTAAAATRTEATATARTTAATRTACAAGTILRFVDTQLTATHRETVQRLDGLGGLGLRHLDESKTARAAGLTIGRQRDGLDRTVLREQVAHLGLGRREGQISNIDLHDSISRFK